MTGMRTLEPTLGCPKTNQAISVTSLFCHDKSKRGFLAFFRGNRANQLTCHALSRVETVLHASERTHHVKQTRIRNALKPCAPTAFIPGICLRPDSDNYVTDELSIGAISATGTSHQAEFQNRGSRVLPESPATNFARLGLFGKWPHSSAPHWWPVGLGNC